METVPHPWWAEFAERSAPKEGESREELERRIYYRCPADLTYAIRWVGNACEWYAPEHPKEHG